MEMQESKVLEKWRETSSITGFFISVITTIIILAISMVANFMSMLFSSGEDGMRYCFFNTIFFNSVTQGDGTSNISFGFTGEIFPIVFFFGATFLFVFGTFYVTKNLLQYREYLIEQRRKEH